MKTHWSNLPSPAKLLTVCVVVLLVSSGLCGLQLAIVHTTSGDALTGVFMALGIFELATMAASVVIAVGTLIVWGLKAAFNRSKPNGETTKYGGQSSDPQTLFPRENPPDDDEKK